MWGLCKHLQHCEPALGTVGFITQGCGFFFYM